MLARSLTQRQFAKACDLIPGGVCSPIRAFLELSMLPLIVKKGEEDKVFDIDSHAYIDYCMSWGSLILGHAHPKVVKAVCDQMALGSSFGITTLLEQELAEKIRHHMPSLEKIRFVSSGTEATMSALRLARGYTGKSCFIKFNGNYHGHADPFLVQAGSGVSFLPTASSLGIPEEVIADTLSLPYNDIEAVKKAFLERKDIAAVIVEPIAANMGLVAASQEFLKTLREETLKAGALLIFDEVITGFRIGLGGVQGKVGIKPDLTCLGKIIGGGLPAAAFGGKKEVMDLLAPIGGVYQAGTLSGNPLALSAGLATLSELEKPSFYKDLEEKTTNFLAPLKDFANSHPNKIYIAQEESLFTLFFGPGKVTCQEDLKHLNPELFQKFYHHMIEQGIYFSPSQREACFLSSAHSLESLEKTKKAVLNFFSIYLG